MIGLAYAFFILLPSVADGIQASTAPAGTPATPTADWLDEMPAVPLVIEVVRAQVESMRRKTPALRTDDDLLAARIVGTLVNLRYVMLHQLIREGTLSPERKARFAKILEAYEQVEFYIGRRAGMRRSNSANCDGMRNFAGERMHPDLAECQQFLWRLRVSNEVAPFWHRQELFPRLFCAHAKEYQDAVGYRLTHRPGLIDPATSQTMSAGSSPPGPDFCAAYGGDADDDGLCDDWSKPPVMETTLRCPAEKNQVALTHAAMADADHIAVSFIVSDLAPGSSLSLDVFRSPSAGDLQGAVNIGRAVISDPVLLTEGTHAGVVLPRSFSMPPEPRNPYVVVVATQNGGSRASFRRFLLAVTVHGLDAGCLRAVAACDFAGWDCPGVVDSCSNEAPQPWQSELNTLLSSVCYDRVVPFVWNFESQLDSTLNQRNDQALRLHERIRDEASGLLASRSTTSGDLVDVHFVAHSRGAVLLAHTLSLLQVLPLQGLRGGSLRVTLLDTHPADNVFSSASIDLASSSGHFADRWLRDFQKTANDGRVVLPSGMGINAVEVFYQHSPWNELRGVERTMNLWGVGEGDPGIVNHTGVVPTWHDLTRETTLDGAPIGHSEVPGYYLRQGIYKMAGLPVPNGSGAIKCP